MLHAFGSFIYRRRWLTLMVAGVFLGLSVASLAVGGKLSGGIVRGLEAQQAEALMSGVTGTDAETTFVVLFRSASMDAASREFARDVDKALEIARKDSAVLFAQPRAAQGHVAYALMAIKGDSTEALAAYPRVRALLKSDTLEINTTGRLPFMYDLNTTLEKDLLRAELISFPLALLVLLLVFRTVVAAALPIGVGALAVLGGIATLFALSHGVEISQYAINVCSLIGLGVAIDYSLFTVSRYREELAEGHGYQEALARTVDHAGRVVAFSAMAVCLGLVGLTFFTGTYLVTMGVGGAIVVGFAAVFAVTFLPALLAVLGPRIHALPLPIPKMTLKIGFWHRLSQWVMKRPVQVLIPTLAVLLLLGYPAVHLRLGSADVSVLPADAQARRGYELLRASFPDAADTEVTVAVAFPSEPATTPERTAAVADLSRRIAALPGVRKVQAPYSKGAVTILQALSSSPVQSEEARAIVRAVRASPSVADGKIAVGGETAVDIDTTAKLLSRAPWAVGFVVLATLMVLAALLRSVLLPIKAVLMNLLSIAGSYGALVWIFQDGHLISTPGRPLEPALPVLLFCVLFGLSMDYEVLILSRMKEAWDRTGDNRLAVAEGLEKTGGLVTSAAAIMVAVFLAFASAHVVLIRAVGVGMAVAVALDATLVRVLLVPATMRLFGDANWWFPFRKPPAPSPAIHIYSEEKQLD